MRHSHSDDGQYKPARNPVLYNTKIIERKNMTSNGEVVLRILDAEDGTISPPPKFSVPMEIVRNIDRQNRKDTIPAAFIPRYPDPDEKATVVSEKLLRGETCLFQFTDPSDPDGPKLTAQIEAISAETGIDAETNDQFRYLFVVCGLKLEDYEALFTYGYITSQQF